MSSIAALGMTRLESVGKILWLGLALACASCGADTSDALPSMDTGGKRSGAGGTLGAAGRVSSGGTAALMGGTGVGAVGGATAGGTMTGGSAFGGASSMGGSASGGIAQSTGGTGTGGSRQSAGGTGTGGLTTGGSATGGSAIGGLGTGGRGQGMGGTTGGTLTGGVGTTGGSAAGGVATGGQPTDGVATGGRATGGAATGGTGTGGCSVAPVNPNATQAVRNVLCYLYQIYKTSTLSGVQDCHWSPISDVTYVYNTTGVYPAVVGGDFLYTNAVSQATTAWNAGSLSMIRYHMGRPEDADSYESSQGTTDLAQTLTPGTSRYNGLMTKFNHASSELLRLQAAGVVVLWAPFHEAQPNGWFWWSKGTADQFKQLWTLMFNDFASKGVNNVIWLMPFSGSPSASFYPGKQYVDMSGSDTYGDGQPFAGNYRNTVTAVGSSTLPLALHETGYVPNPTDMFNNAQAPWVLFSVWCTADWLQSTSKNTVAELRNAFVNPRTINRGGMPRF